MGKTRCTIHEQVTQESEGKAASGVASQRKPPPPFPQDMNATLLQTFHHHDLNPGFWAVLVRPETIEWWASIDALSELRKVIFQKILTIKSFSILWLSSFYVMLIFEAPLPSLQCKEAVKLLACCSGF